MVSQGDYGVGDIRFKTAFALQMFWTSFVLPTAAASTAVGIPDLGMLCNGRLRAFHLQQHSKLLLLCQGGLWGRAQLHQQQLLLLSPIHWTW